MRSFLRLSRPVLSVSAFATNGLILDSASLTALSMHKTRNQMSDILQLVVEIGNTLDITRNVAH
jgi:hypothetical protein